MSCRRGLARIHMADDHNVDVGLLFAHAGSCSERGQVCSGHELATSCPELLFLGTGPAQPAEGEAGEENTGPGEQRGGLSNTSHLRLLRSSPPAAGRMCLPPEPGEAPPYLLTPRTDQRGIGPHPFYSRHLQPTPQIPCSYWSAGPGMHGENPAPISQGVGSPSPGWEEDELADHQKEAPLGFELLIESPFPPPLVPGWALGSGPRVRDRPGVAGGPRTRCPWVFRPMCLWEGGVQERVEREGARGWER